MLTKDSLAQDIQTLKQQYTQGQFRLWQLQQETQVQAQTLERLALTIQVSEKFLAQFDVSDLPSGVNGQPPHRATVGDAAL